MEMQKVKENAEMNKAYIIMVLMALCVILVPLIAYSVGDWYAYWGTRLARDNLRNPRGSVENTLLLLKSGL